jgi:hypothetical protein
MQGNPTYRLVVRRGPQPNQSYELTGDVTNIGRDITNEIVINDREVSRHHMRLMRGQDGYTIEDLGSTNGTFVNGKRLTGATPLKNGDMIGLGETVTLAFEVVRSGQADAGAATDEPDEPQQTVESRSEQQPQQQPPSQPEQPAQQPQQEQNPYQQPQQQPAQQYQYQSQQDDDYYGGGQQEEQDEYAVQGAYGPPPPGYDYDPYSMREEEGNSTARWVLFGCLGLVFFCCCISVISLVIIDTFVLYCDIPVLRDVLQALDMMCMPQ